MGGAHSKAMPRHVAIIMDGNGRWAKARGLPRSAGHQAGVERVREVVRVVREAGIEYLTLFAFSSENWNRPKTEVTHLMGLLKIFIRRDLDELNRSNVRIRVVGNRDTVQSDVRPLLDEAEQKTAANTGPNLIIAFNYGSRDEIVRAARKLALKVARGEIDAAAINEDAFSGALDTAGIPDPDLVIRTSGEQRLSNFLMWQAAYAEFVFAPCYWPDFDARAFHQALEEYRRRDRRFGLVEAPDLAVGS